MNSPQPVPSGTTNVAPTLGSLIGGIAGLVTASKLGMDPLSPAGGSVAVSVTATVTALFHWIGKATGIPGLG
jgi:hypothetical protein